MYNLEYIARDMQMKIMERFYGPILTIEIKQFIGTQSILWHIMGLHLGKNRKKRQGQEHYYGKK